jgi:eukaryotic-like serine/threonine-protein kinase
MNGPSWYEAAAYCNALSRRENLEECYAPNSEGEFAEGMTCAADFLDRPGYRLPTEAEWEYACRAGAVTSRYYGGSVALLEQYAWYNLNSRVRAWPCGQLQPNDLGLFDMLGNLFEWCQDEYSSHPPGRTVRLRLWKHRSGLGLCRLGDGHHRGRHRIRRAVGDVRRLEPWD